MSDKSEQGGSRFEPQARVLLSKLKEPGRESLSLGPEAYEVVLWLVQRDLVELEETSEGFTIRLKTNWSPAVANA